MDEQQAKIQEDLRGLISGDVRCDDVFTHLYASDASIYQIRPLGVVRPRETSDVVAVVKYAREHNLALHVRGAGTGLAGESLGAGLVVDFSKYMRRQVSAGPDTVRVQPGLVLERLNRLLATSGRQFGADPATEEVTTIGSVLAIDGAGSHSLKYGSASQHVRSLQVVLADGTVLEVGREPLDQPPDSPLRRRDLVSQLSDLIRRHADLIAHRRSMRWTACWTTHT
jgi:FAD/FMN-containing dehydrogenase